MLSRCFLDCYVGIGVFVTGLSQISAFFSPYRDRGQTANPNGEVIKMHYLNIFCLRNIISR